MSSIEVDSRTGRKIFHTRAEPASDKIRGYGYTITDDTALKVLPPQRPGAVFKAEEQAKYLEYKEQRKGAADYISMDGEFSRYLQDVHSSPPVPREALTDECDIVVVGAGFAGLLLWHKLPLIRPLHRIRSNRNNSNNSNNNNRSRSRSNNCCCH